MVLYLSPTWGDTKWTSYQSPEERWLILMGPQSDDLIAPGLDSWPGAPTIEGVNLEEVCYGFS